MIAPGAAHDQWDRLIVGGKVAPGIVRLSGDGLKIGWDIQNATGTTGAVTKRINEPLKEFDAEFELSDEPGPDGRTDFDDWDEFQAMLEATVQKGKKPRALDVYHPDLARVHITAATFGSAGLVMLDGKGGGRIKVHFLEFSPPKPNKPVASTKTEGDKKIDAANAEIDRLQKEWKSL